MCGSSIGASAQQPNPNPTNDPRIQKDYDEHQKAHREKVAAEARQPTTDLFTVKVSGPTASSAPGYPSSPPPKKDKPNQSGDRFE
jgi:hypothetical protein